MRTVTGILLEDRYKIVIVFRSILLIMGNVSDKICGENQNKFMFNNFFFENHAIYEIVWKKNIVQLDRRHMTTAHALHTLDN
jgi:hypothetical protein